MNKVSVVFVTPKTSNGMKTLKEYIKKAEEEGKAIGHFNISNIEGLWAVFNAAKNLSTPVIVGVSEGERDAIGLKQAVALVKSIKEEYFFPIFINADHSYTFERVRDAIDAGYDMVIFDGAKLSMEENMREMLRCVEYARKVSSPVLIEAELGFIGQSSKIIDVIPEGVSEETQTKPEDAKKFFEDTGIDAFAPSIGNVHGIVRGGNPKLNIERIKQIKEVIDIPLVLHGASGIPDEEIKSAINAGISVIHFNTELRVAYMSALREYITKNSDESTPYKITKTAMEAMQKVVDAKIRLFNGL